LAIQQNSIKNNALQNREPVNQDSDGGKVQSLYVCIQIWCTCCRWYSNRYILRSSCRRSTRGI